MFDKNKFLGRIVIIILLLFIAYLAFFIRAGELDNKTVAGSDPYWFYRHAEEIVKNNYIIPQWDLLSFYPPGRPYSIYQGWSYIIATIYRISDSIGLNYSLMDIAKFSPIIMILLSIIPAFLLGRMLTNKWGGLFTALFIVITPAILVVSMGSYPDTDVVVVFYILLSIYTILLAIKKQKIPYYILVVIINLLFIWSWHGGWLPIILFIFFIPAIIIYRGLEQIVFNRGFKINKKELKDSLFNVLKPLLIVIVVTSIIGSVLGLGSPINSLLGGLGFTGLAGKQLIVNISVAELQRINAFTLQGFQQIALRVGLLPTILTLIFLPIFILFKLITKRKSNHLEIFLFFWAVVGYVLISTGSRFLLLFSIPASVTAGYLIGIFIKMNSKPIIKAIPLAVIVLLTLFFISDAILIGLNTRIGVSKNWYNALDWLKENADENSLIATWWDPGHLITGYTGLKVHADGAHCGNDCIPYNHDDRIRDMGKILTTSDENEAASLLDKYRRLSDQQCQRVRKIFGSIVPQNACNPIKDVYFIASGDLIGKYTWPSFFGSFDYNKYKSGNYKDIRELGQGRNFINLGLTRQNNNEFQYGGGVISIVQKNNSLIPILSSQGANFVIKEMILFQNSQLERIVYNTTNSIDSLLWVNPDFRSVIYMESEIKNSMFTRMYFFNGEGLNRFELVYSNPEVKIFKVKFDEN